MTTKPRQPSDSKARKPAPPFTIGPLNSIGKCKGAMGRVIRAAASGKIPTADMTRYVHALGELARLIEWSVIEKRLEVLEAEPPSNRGPDVSGATDYSRAEDDEQQPTRH